MGERALRRVLLVEDEPDVRLVAKLSLSAVGGLTVEACESGRQALDCLASFQPDLVLLDVQMPELDGPATLQLIRQLPGSASLPVIFLTAHGRLEELSLVDTSGVLGVIGKPFDPLSLARQVAELWGGSHD